MKDSTVPVSTSRAAEVLLVGPTLESTRLGRRGPASAANRREAAIAPDAREAAIAAFRARAAMDVHYSSASAEWYTPPAVIERVTAVLGPIALDPCSNEGEPVVPAQRHFTRSDDGLALPWSGPLYMNPPYGRSISAWVEKLVREHAAGNVAEAVALVPARTDTAWFANLRDCAVCFVRGRLHFSGSSSGAPFPSAVAYFGSDPRRFHSAFGDMGDIWLRWTP